METQRTYVQNFHVISNFFWRNTNLNSNILVTSLQDQKVAMLLATQKAGRLPSFLLPAQLHENGPEATSIVWLDWCRSFGGTRGQRTRSEILAGVLFMDGFWIRDPTRASDWGHLEKSLPPNIRYLLATLVSYWICLPCWGIYYRWKGSLNLKPSGFGLTLIHVLKFEYRIRNLPERPAPSILSSSTYMETLQHFRWNHLIL